MFRQVLFILLICISTLGIFAQTKNYTAPVNWQRYKITDKNVSVSLPKLPVVTGNLDICRQEETRHYAAFADQTIYGLTITSKAKEGVPNVCNQKKKFDEKSFQARLDKIKDNLKDFTGMSFVQDNFTVNKISGKGSVYWLIDDLNNQRWFELWVIEGNEEKAEVKDFLKSIKIGKNAQGIEIGDGAERMLGDEFVRDDSTQTGETTELRIIYKPRPRYPEEAKTESVQGKISLKITFSANGSISDITPVRSLPSGLTKASINAAQKIIFIPMKQDGKPVTVSRVIEYSFAIY